jgi:hypothetical protein
MAKKQPPHSGHYDLYLIVRRLEAIVGKQRVDHPRTKVWKDLEEITQAIDEIQKDWFRRKS